MFTTKITYVGEDHYVQRWMKFQTMSMIKYLHVFCIDQMLDRSR